MRKVSVLTEGFSSSVCLAISDFVASKKIPFVCRYLGSDAIVWEQATHLLSEPITSTTCFLNAGRCGLRNSSAKRWATIAQN